MEQLTEQKESYKDWLNRLATTNTSTEKDSRLMESLLRNHLGCPNARVVIGIVYLEGYGPPTSIHSIAKMIVRTARVVEGNRLRCCDCLAEFHETDQTRHQQENAICPSCGAEDVTPI